LIRVFKILKKKYVSEAFSGEGSLTHEGRWHRPGSRVVYTASSEPLAALETLVHVEQAELPDDLVMIPAEIPDDLKIININLASLPKNWKSYPAPWLLQDIGDNWFSKRQSAVLRVPSAVISTVNNYLLNPLHPEFTRIVIKMKELIPFIIDKRLLQKKT
jgi:RES domain-containing protein